MVRNEFARVFSVLLCMLGGPVLSSASYAQVMSQAERQKFVAAYAQREKTILEQVFNYTGIGREDGGQMAQNGDGFFWVSGAKNAHKCVMTMYRHDSGLFGPGPREPWMQWNIVDVREVNQTAFRLVQQLTGQVGTYPGHYVINATDGNKVIVPGAQNTQMDRLQKAWGLAFQECPGKKSAF